LIFCTHLTEMKQIRIEDGWKNALNDLFSTDWFFDLSEFIRAEYQHHQIFPPAKDLFRAFDLCPWQKTRVIILGQDPYIRHGQAQGLSFSVPEGVPLPPSLQNIFKEIQRETGKASPASGDLSRWAEQGVLLLNSVLSVREGISNSHQGYGWETFTDEVICRLSERKENLVFLLWGSSARQKAALIDNSRHLILESAHPSPMSVYRGFEGNGHFILCNEYLRNKGHQEIIW
jgi:uracil-DNA glycosylase